MQGMTVNWSKQIRQQAIFLQGDVARLLMRLPMGVQEQLARWSRNPHHSLHPHLQLLVAAQRLQGGQHGIVELPGLLEVTGANHHMAKHGSVYS